MNIGNNQSTADLLIKHNLPSDTVISSLGSSKRSMIDLALADIKVQYSKLIGAVRS
ncbi:MAG: hypothetical protein V7784_11950 [Oceanospirillaceae bacterium]